MSTSPASIGSVDIEPGERRWGRLELPADPPASYRLIINPQWTAAQLLRAVLLSGGWLAVAGGTLVAVFTASTMLLPILIGWIVDTLITPLVEGTPLSGLAWTAAWSGLAITCLYLLMHVTFRFGGRLGWRAVQRITYELSQQILERALDERGAERQRPAGELLSIATADVRRVTVVIALAVYPPGSLLALVVAAVSLSTINGWLGLGMIVGLPVVFMLMHFAARPLIMRSLREQRDLADAASSAADLLAGFRVLRGLRAHPVAAARYRAVSRTALDSTLSARSASAGLEGLQSAIGQLFAAALVCLAAWLALTGQISVGQLVVAAGLAVMILGPLEVLLVEAVEWIAQARASATRLMEMLRDAPNPAALGETALGDGGGAALEFDGLRLDGDVTITERIEPGEFVIVSLPQAAGAALASVLALETAPGGAVKLAGVDLASLRVSDVRSRVLVPPRTPGILAGSVRDNVSAVGPSSASLEGTTAALGAVQLGEDELPDGYETVVGDGGFELSGGQRQRVALARSIAAAPDVLVLQDPTTSVDAVTEQRIADALRTKRAGKTTIVLGATPALVKVADRVIEPSQVLGAASRPGAASTGVGGDAA